jgi:hypothetical protein
MADESDHGAQVDAWLERARAAQPGHGLAPAFEAAFTRIWERARQPLGDVTLHAIVDRVLYVAAEQHPLCAGLSIGDEGLSADAFRERAQRASDAELEAGVRFVLVEFLTVLGSLTAEILSPALHAELANVDQQDQPE